jgi:TusA-related sulfurtransferase
MGEKTVDARGLSCPEPVLLAKRAIKQLEDGTLDVLVDTVTSRENVTRMAESLSCRVEVDSQEDDSFVLHVKKGSYV